MAPSYDAGLFLRSPPRHSGPLSRENRQEIQPFRIDSDFYPFSFPVLRHVDALRWFFLCVFALHLVKPAAPGRPRLAGSRTGEVKGRRLVHSCSFSGLFRLRAGRLKIAKRPTAGFSLSHPRIFIDGAVWGSGGHCSRQRKKSRQVLQNQQKKKKGEKEAQRKLQFNQMGDKSPAGGRLDSLFSPPVEEERLLLSPVKTPAQTSARSGTLPPHIFHQQFHLEPPGAQLLS